MLILAQSQGSVKSVVVETAVIVRGSSSLSLFLFIYSLHSMLFCESFRCTA